MTSAFQRTVSEETKKSGGKGTKGSWHERLSIPKAPEPPAAFILLKAEYDYIPDVQVAGKKAEKRPFFRFKKHRRKWTYNGQERFADEVCSRGNDPFNPKSCVGCLAMDSGDKSVGISDTYAIPVYHLAKYHGHPIPNKEGTQWLTKQNSSEYVIAYDECTGRLCNFCRVQAGQPPFPPGKGEEPFPQYPDGSLSTVFGRRRYLEIGKGHLSNLLGWDWTVSRNCGTCGSQMETTAYYCPQCEATLIDPMNDPRKDKELVEAASKEGQCPNCGQTVFPVEEQVCPVCENTCEVCGGTLTKDPASGNRYCTGKCGNQWRQGRQSTPQEIYDVVLLGQRQGEGTNSTLMLMGHKPIDRFAREDLAADPVIIQAMGGKTLRQILDEVKEYDFAEMFKPRTLQEQAKRLALDIPGIAGPQENQGPGHSQWGAPAPAPFVPPPRPNFGK